MRTFYRVFILILSVLTGVFLLVFTPVDRTPYQELGFYAEMNLRLDSLRGNLQTDSLTSPLFTGWSKVSITPSDKMPLAGYGKRKPKEWETIHDSIFVRTILFQSGEQKAALISADLLIFHPVVTHEIAARLPSGWTMNEIYLTTTHSHSSLGGWAPGFLGEAISGNYNDTLPAFIADRVIEGIEIASNEYKESQIGLAEQDLGQLVHNRLVHEKGDTDPWLKSILVDQSGRFGILNFYSAHATCLTSDFRELSGDFPGHLNDLLDKDSLFSFSLYGAGPVGSMGPVTKGQGFDRVVRMSGQLKSQVDLLPMIVRNMELPLLRSFRVRLPLREPNAKIAEKWAIRPFIFKKIAGDYEVELSVLQLGNTVLIGIPADFSGELALPLYKKARDLGLDLIITSFNGGYMGYIIKDEWYDLNKYESRSMSWYGPDMGSYLSEVIIRILEIVS